MEDVLAAVRQYGFMPASIYPLLNWRKQPRGGWGLVARDYRTFEWWDVPTIEHFGSAIARGFPCVVGVDWEGGGHAILAVGLDRRKRGGVWFEIQNSWGADAGDGGFYWLPERQVKAGIKVYGAWCPREVTIPGSQGMVPEPRTNQA